MVLHISPLGGVSCSLISKPCAFVACSTRFCANFVLQETNVLGLGMRLGLLAQGQHHQQTKVTKSGRIVPRWSSNLCGELLLLNILQVRDDRYICREETELLIKCQFTFSCHPSATDKACYQTLCSLLPATKLHRLKVDKSLVGYYLGPNCK